jgi:hypothetical protein
MTIRELCFGSKIFVSHTQATDASRLGGPGVPLRCAGTTPSPTCAIGTRAVRVDGDDAVETGHSDVDALLAEPGWAAAAASADGPRHPFADCDLAPVFPRPSKILCVGLNCRNHILEMGRELPE